MLKQTPTRFVRWVVTAVVVGTLAIATTATVAALYHRFQHNRLINSDDYKAKYGKWEVVTLPKDIDANIIHSIVLPTGKVLLIAGSGNDHHNSDKGIYNSLIFDPETRTAKRIDTPVDLFCSDHAYLADGTILIAGGTGSYEVLPENLTHAGGYMTIRNEDPDHPGVVPKGTTFTGKDSGKVYRSDRDITVPPAAKDPVTYKVSATDRNVYVSADATGTDGVWDHNDHYMIGGLSFAAQQNLYGFAPEMALKKKEYQGIDASYLFNPWTETYEAVGNMNYARWYPTLTRLADGKVMVTSGLDGSGRILDGQTEIYDPATRAWVERDDLRRILPTYPAVFQTASPDLLFFSGPTTGWGPAEEHRDPGLWNLADNSFQPLPGIRDPNMLETGSSTWLGPVQDQRLLVVGGGGVGDSDLSTGRIDIVDLKAAQPRFEPLAVLPQGTRYPNLVPLPSGDVFITNGAHDYRGRGSSDILAAFLLDQQGGLHPMADPTVGRDYHSTAVLLPSGQIMTEGSNPLFADKKNTLPGKFERRIEIYTPPYLYKPDGGTVARPVITGGPTEIRRGENFEYTVGSTLAEVPAAADIKYMRLIAPAAITHVTDTNEKVIDLPVTRTDSGLSVAVPDNSAIAPSGYYMLFAVDAAGVPGVAKWVHLG
ncbi:radical copper oxidase GlxA [Nocardia terrae]|uniref:galactose oxidase-like domain-containing protein n=1 Tax=Nocardia terrae TaxID=2675851 RepID=UPI0012FA3EEF|nr:galactose oxidase-like domain-containing protein [Nocardia terrae]